MKKWVPARVQSRVVAAFIFEERATSLTNGIYKRRKKEPFIVVTWRIELECGRIIDRDVRCFSEKKWISRPQRAECDCNLCIVRTFDAQPRKRIDRRKASSGDAQEVVGANRAECHFQTNARIGSLGPRGSGARGISNGGRYRDRFDEVAICR